MIDQYENKQDVIPSYKASGEKVYFIQYGVYSSVKSMEDNTINLTKYIYMFKNDLYYVFIGITKDNKNLDKLKGYFDNIGYSTYVKEFEIKDFSFLDTLTNYDLLLEQTNDQSSIKEIQTKILEIYEDVKEWI